jgi:hypothetical protein
MNADVFAFTAVGVWIEVANEGALDDSARHYMERAYGVVLRQGKRQISDGAGLGVADCGSSGIADGVDGGLGFFAEADDEQSLGFQSGGGVEEYGFVCAGFVFAAGEDRSGGGADGFIAGQQDRLGFSVGALGGLGVDGGDGEEFGFDLGEGGEGEVSLHTRSLFHCEEARQRFAKVP